MLSRLWADMPGGARHRLSPPADAQHEIHAMTSTDRTGLDLSRHLNSGLQKIAAAHGVDAVLQATTTAAHELADSFGVCAVPIDHAHCVISTLEYGSVTTPDGTSPLQRLITSAAATGETIVQHRPAMEIELATGQRFLAETLLTVPLGAESGYLGLAFFWRDGMSPSAAQLTLLPALAWTTCLALRSQQQESKLNECRREQSSQIAELHHRCRNQLATVRSIIRRSSQTAESLDEFASHMEARIGALARTLGALNIDQAAGPELEDLIRVELTAAAVRDDQFVISGPSLRLTPRAAETMALTLHELTTNAVKFGAFTSPGGHLAVSWTIDNTPNPTLRWRWVESNVRVAQTAPRRRGFGRELIERLLPYELGAATRYTMADDGVVCEIDLPLNEHTTATREPTSFRSSP